MAASAAVTTLTTASDDKRAKITAQQLTRIVQKLVSIHGGTRQLAEAARLSYSTISALEKGETNSPHQKTTEKVMLCIDVAPRWCNIHTGIEFTMADLLSVAK